MTTGQLGRLVSNNFFAIFFIHRHLLSLAWLLRVSGDVVRRMCGLVPCDLITDMV